MSQTTLTGIKDVDREIVNKLNDRDLLNMCSMNKTYAERVCDDSYFRLRTEARFPETIKYKDYIKITNENKVNERTRRVRTWKNHYLAIVKYIDLLQTDFRYKYKSQDKSPELLYLSRKLIPNLFDYTNDESLVWASRDGKLMIVKYVVENGADINYRDNEALRFASENGHLPIVKYLVENGADITADDNEPIKASSENGYLSVVKYLVLHGADIIHDNSPLRLASLNGHLPIVKYLVENGADITARDNIALIEASKNGHLQVVEYLRSLM